MTATGQTAQIGRAIMLVLVGVLLAVVVAAPIALSSGDLLRWAASPHGLGLGGWWPWLVFISLDAAAGVCILLSLYCAMTGQPGTVFKLLVWVFAAASAVANYRHNIAPGSPGDGWWFFPGVSLLGPALLEAITWLIRRMVERRRGERVGARPKFGLLRWLPIVGSPRDTYGAYRTAQILGIATVQEAVATYHELCPDGSLRVVRAIRARNVALAKAAAAEAERTARAAARQATNQPTKLRAVAASGNRPSKATIRASLASGHPTKPGDHTQRAIADAATIRREFPNGLPADRGAQRFVRDHFGWHSTKATNAVRAYQDGADLQTSTSTEDGAQ